MKKMPFLVFAGLLLPLAISNAQEPETMTGSTSEAQKIKTRQDKATINLSTTVTGNQEQPRVLYILPWQSPTSSDIEFKGLLSQQKEVFSHIEREELRRSLKAEAALNPPAPPE